MQSNGVYDFTVDWGDGKIDRITRHDQAEVNHQYSQSGTKTVKIRGELKGFRFNDGGDKNKLIKIINWGSMNLGNDGDYFEGAGNLVSISGTPNLTGTTNFASMFRQARKFNGGSIRNWNTENITRMDNMFNWALDFNQPIGSWDVSKVTDINNMFRWAYRFNQNIGSWDVENVTKANEFLYEARGFDHDISRWYVCEKSSMFNQYDYNTYVLDTHKKPKFNHPCIVKVNSSLPNGKYFPGDVINITLEFDKAVNIHGNINNQISLVLKLNNGNKKAYYSKGSGTKNLTFNYTVADDDLAPNLDYVGRYSLEASAGFIVGVSPTWSALLTLPRNQGKTLGSNKNISVYPDPTFVSTWDTSKISSGSSNTKQIRLPLESDGDYDFTVYWDDGTSDHITTSNYTSAVHTYSKPGIYELAIVGKIEGFRFNLGGDRNTLINITRWGDRL